jgi:hypothetical protein
MMGDAPIPDCVTLQLAPADCAALLAPEAPPEGAGWLILAILLAAVAGALLVEW